MEEIACLGAALLARHPLSVMRCLGQRVEPRHRHEFQELVLVLGGKGTHWVEDESYQLQAGDTFVLLGDMRHGYPETKDLSLINIIFEPRRLQLPTLDLGTIPGYHALFVLEPTLRGQRNYRNRLRLSEEHLAEALRLVAELEAELESNTPGQEFLAAAHFMRLVGFLSRRYSQLEDGSGKHPPQQLGALLGHMERNYDKPLTVKDLMRVSHMSQTSLMRTFKRLLGRSPVEHLIRLRISHAEQLLRDSDLTLAEIAERTGFCDSNYLSRQFRQVVGVPPSEYRGRKRV